MKSHSKKFAPFAPIAYVRAFVNGIMGLLEFVWAYNLLIQSWAQLQTCTPLPSFRLWLVPRMYQEKNVKANSFLLLDFTIENIRKNKI